MKKPRQHKVIAQYLGSNKFMLCTKPKPIAVVAVDPYNEMGQPVPPDEWLTNQAYIETVLVEQLIAAATHFLGTAPIGLHVSLPEGAAAPKDGFWTINLPSL